MPADEFIEASEQSARDWDELKAERDYSGCDFDAHGAPDDSWRYEGGESDPIEVGSKLTYEELTKSLEECEKDYELARDDAEGRLTYINLLEGRYLRLCTVLRAERGGAAYRFPSTLVEIVHACPRCGERDEDHLVITNDESILCSTCGLDYRPHLGGMR